MNSKQSVLLIHGIASDGAWQEALEPVLSPFFNVTVLKYPQFRRLGALKIVAEPLLLGLALAILLIAVLIMVLAGPNGYVWISIFVGVVIALFACTPLGVSFRRNSARKRLTNDGGGVFAGFPHVIAHSLGTYLTVSLIRFFKDRRFARIVLVGCVLPRDIDWNGLKKGDTFDEILNDWNKSDPVPIAARIAGFLHRDLGGAGRAGFTTRPGVVHGFGSTVLECAACVRGDTAFVHNLHSPGFAHSGALIPHDHVIRYWLPFLWKIDLAEYERLRVLSLRHADNFERLRYDVSEALETELREVRWKFVDNDTVHDALETELRLDKLPVTPHDVALAVHFFMRNVADAFRAPTTSGDGILYLNPHIALRAAARRARAASA